MPRTAAFSLAIACLLLTGAVVGTVGANASYWNSTDSEHDELVQWAQPHNEVRPTIEDVERVIEHVDAESEGGADVLFVGTAHPDDEDDVRLYLRNESSKSVKPVGGPAWHNRLPFPWYVERAGGVTDSVSPDADAAAFTADAPPIVVAKDWDRECETDGDRCLDDHLDGYVAYEHPVRLWGERLVFYVDEEALAAARAADDVDGVRPPTEPV